MSNNVKEYAAQCLAGAGFAIIDSEVAMTLRPDLWTSGIECHGAFASHHAPHALGALVGVQRFKVLFEGAERPLLVLVRCSDQLQERIRWVTGRRVLDLAPEAEEIKPREPASRAKWREFQQRREPVEKAPAVTIPPRKERPVPPDVEGLVGQFAEPPRPCTACGNRNSAGTCLPAARGEFQGRPTNYRPSADHPRRCLHYSPGTHLTTGERRDTRTGRELWPELLTTKAQAASTTAPPEGAEPAGASDKAREILAAMLNDGPRNASEIRAAAEGAEISERTMQMVAERMGVVKTKAGFEGGWVWALPEGAQVA